MLLDIIAQHPDFIVVNKPAGLSCHCDDEAGVFERVRLQLGLPQVFPVHRLDKPTSGVLLIATNAAAAEQLNRQFRNKTIDKRYLALANKTPRKKQGWIIGDMAKSRRGQWKLESTTVNPAISYFFSQSIAPHQRLFIIKPYTGKTHQIRVALKSIGSPITGDSLYNASSEADRTYLHAYFLSFMLHDQRYHYQSQPTGALVSEEWTKLLTTKWAEETLVFPTNKKRTLS